MEVPVGSLEVTLSSITVSVAHTEVLIEASSVVGQNVDQAGPVDIPIGSFLPPAAQAAGKSGVCSLYKLVHISYC